VTKSELAEIIRTNLEEELDSKEKLDSKDDLNSKESDRVILPNSVLQPYYRGFQGTIEYERSTNRFWIHGKYSTQDDGRSSQKIILVEEIPIMSSFGDYSTHLMKLRNKEWILNYDTKLIPDSDHLHFEIIVTNDQYERLKTKNFSPLKLSRPLSLNNIVLFDEQQLLRRYKSLDLIFDEFYKARLPYFAKRKESILASYRDEYKLLHNKRRFIDMIIKHEIELGNVKEALLLDVLEEEKFDSIIKTKKGTHTKTEMEGDDEEGDEEEETRDHEVQIKDEKEPSTKKKKPVDPRKKGFEYLLSMRINQQTEEQFNKLKYECEELEAKIKIIENQTPEDLWISDLNELSSELSKQLNPENKKSTVRPKNMPVKKTAQAESKTSSFIEPIVKSKVGDKRKERSSSTKSKVVTEKSAKRIKRS
jgi:DNA topoisomerase-2